MDFTPSVLVAVLAFLIGFVVRVMRNRRKALPSSQRKLFAQTSQVQHLLGRERTLHPGGTPAAPSVPEPPEPFRPATDAERELLRAVIESLDGDTPAKAELIAQLPSLQVRRGCPCGCPTLDLEGLRTPAAASWKAGPDLCGLSPEKVLVGLIQFIDREGRLTQLEGYDVAGLSQGPFSFPTARDLKDMGEAETLLQTLKH